MQGDVIGGVALDFVLRSVRARVMDVSLVVRVFRMHSDDFAGHVARLRVPAHVITYFECRSHVNNFPSSIGMRGRAAPPVAPFSITTQNATNEHGPVEHDYIVRMTDPFMGPALDGAGVRRRVADTDSAGL